MKYVKIEEGLGWLTVWVFFMMLGTCATAESVSNLADNGVTCRVEIVGE